MKIYILKADANRFQNLCLIDEEEWERLREFDGTPLLPSWPPLGVQVVREDELNNHLLKGDFPLLTFHIPVFSKKASLALKSFLIGNGELLPLSCKEDEYYGFNVTQVLDALDEDKSKVVRFPEGNVLDIKEYVFREDRLENYPIFKLKQTPLMDVFVTDEFKQSVEKSKLAGFLFKLIYDSGK